MNFRIDCWIFGPPIPVADVVQDGEAVTATLLERAVTNGQEYDFPKGTRLRFHPVVVDEDGNIQPLNRGTIEEV